MKYNDLLLTIVFIQNFKVYYKINKKYEPTNTR